MSRTITYYPIQGGEDLVSPPLSVDPGRLLFSKNYECDFNGRARRIDGYERFDGQASPTAAGDAVVQGVDEDDDVFISRKHSAIEEARELISTVPGSGPVRGVWVYRDNVYAFRDDAAGETCGMWVDSADGWDAVPLGSWISFSSGGTYEVVEGDTITGATSGATAVVERIVVTSGYWDDGNTTGYIVISGQVGTFQVENLKVGSNLDVASVAGDSSEITLLPGGRFEFDNYNFFGQAATYRMYGVDGVNLAFEFDGTVFCPLQPNLLTTPPTHIKAHAKHLFLVYPSGSVRHSGIGNPQAWDGSVSGGGEIAIGDNCVGIDVQVGGILAVFGRNSTWLLSGTSIDDWQLSSHSRQAGAIEWTIQNLNQAIYLDDSGITSLVSVQNFGDFAAESLSRDIFPLINEKRSLAVASLTVKQKNQYRLYFSDGSGLAMTFHNGKVVGVTRIEYGTNVACCCGGEISGVESLFFGDADGYVYQLDKGTSFDGGEVEAMIRMPFNHLKSPESFKRFFKAVVEIDAPESVSIEWAEDYDYGLEGGRSIDVDVFSGGGRWNISSWNEFAWSTASVGTGEAYLDGSGKNIGIFIGSWHVYEQPHTLQGIILHYSIRGLSR